MCTLSWLIHDNGYEIFFNRDENRNRPKAYPPELKSSLNAIMPLDPQGQGTWIATHKSGLTLCLLNNYQKIVKQSNKNTSRGQIIPFLINTSSLDDIYESLNDLTLSDYQGFILCVFPPDTCSSNNSIYIFQWDGELLTQIESKQPVISSAVSLEKVAALRTQTFNQLTSINDSSKIRLMYHCSHIPEKNANSVCMHREDARTQSFSHITVNTDITFRYHDGPPCQNNNWFKIHLPIGIT